MLHGLIAEPSASVACVGDLESTVPWTGGIGVAGYYETRLDLNSEGGRRSRSQHTVVPLQSLSNVRVCEVLDGLEDSVLGVRESCAAGVMLWLES